MIGYLSICLSRLLSICLQTETPVLYTIALITLSQIHFQIFFIQTFKSNICIYSRKQSYQNPRLVEHFKTEKCRNYRCILVVTFLQGLNTKLRVLLHQMKMTYISCSRSKSAEVIYW